MQYSEDDNNELSVQFHFVYKSINMSFSKQNFILQGISLGHFISPEISCLLYIQKVDFFHFIFIYKEFISKTIIILLSRKD